jgi:arabinose-5-phosphate isomerase
MKTTAINIESQSLPSSLAEPNELKHVEIAREALLAQADALHALAARLGEKFNDAVQHILDCQGRVVVCGMGKSGLVGKKIVATFASTGTPSLYMHPAEAFHGDLGMLKPTDLVILISYSGETEEVIKLLPSLKHFGNKIIAMTAKQNSTLAKHCDLWLDIAVEREVCPNNLAPTTSTLATMAIGDALAVALIQARQFLPVHFARFHPGGSLGRRLLTKVSDVMKTVLPIVKPDTSFYDCLFTMTSGRLGLALVIDCGNLIGIVTDGDLRRALIRSQTHPQLAAVDIMNPNPLTVDAGLPIADAEVFMQEHKVKALIVTNGNARRPVGILEIFS